MKSPLASASAPSFDVSAVIDAIRSARPSAGVDRIVEVFASTLDAWRAWQPTLVQKPTPHYVPRPPLWANFPNPKWANFWREVQGHFGQLATGTIEGKGNLLYERGTDGLSDAIRFAVDELAIPQWYFRGQAVSGQAGPLCAAHQAMQNNQFHWLSTPWRNMLRHRAAGDVLLIQPPPNFDETDALDAALAGHSSCAWVRTWPDGAITTSFGG